MKRHESDKKKNKVQLKYESNCDTQSAISNQQSLVECVPNSAKAARLKRLSDGAGDLSVPTACVLDTHIDPDHNRSVITFVAAPEMVVAAASAPSNWRTNRHAAIKAYIHASVLPTCCLSFHKRSDDG